MTQSNDSSFPKTSHGTMYPKNYVVGVIDDLQEAQQAEQAFKAAGYPSEENRLLTSDEEIHKAQEIEGHKNRLQRFFSSFNSSEAEAQMYQQEAQKGRHVLYVHAKSQDDVDKIGDLMRQHGARMIKFFGSWAVTDIPSSR